MANKFISFLGVKEMKYSKTVLRQLLSEFLGSFLYLAIVLSAGAGFGVNNPTVVIALSNGLIIASLVQIFGHVSGGHINPAVTLGALVGGHVKLIKAILYVLMQIWGSVAGAAIAYAVSSEVIRGNLGATIPYKDTSAAQLFAIEFLLTFVLVAVVLSVVDYDRGARGLGSSPLAIGVCITGCICSASPYTGSLNPIRSFGPAIIMWKWHDHWVFWSAQMSAALVAGLVYRVALGVYHPEEVQDNEVRRTQDHEVRRTQDHEVRKKHDNVRRTRSATRHHN